MRQWTCISLGAAAPPGRCTHAVLGRARTSGGPSDMRWGADDPIARGHAGKLQISLREMRDRQSDISARAVTQQCAADLDLVVRQLRGAGDSEPETELGADGNPVPYRNLGQLPGAEGPDDPVLTVVEDGSQGGVMVTTHSAAARYEVDDDGRYRRMLGGDNVRGDGLPASCLRRSPRRGRAIPRLHR